MSRLEHGQATHLGDQRTGGGLPGQLDAALGEDVVGGVDNGGTDWYTISFTSIGATPLSVAASIAGYWERHWLAINSQLDH